MHAPPAVILLNYKRPQNIGRIVAAARAGLPESTILLLDQAENGDLLGRDDIPWAEIWYRRAAENKGAGARVPLAVELPFERYIAIDDDVFLSPQQIAALAAALDAEPDRAHGVVGQRISLAGGQVRLSNVIALNEAPLSVLNMVYAFSRSQAEAAVALSLRLGWPRWDDVGPVDDMLLSCAASKPPACHNFGPLDLCTTVDEPGVAVWRTEGFAALRRAAARRLIAAQAMTVFRPRPHATP